MSKRNMHTQLIAMVLAAGFVASTARAGDDGDYAKLLKEKAGVLVTVKHVLKVNMAMLGGEQENESELTGVMVDPKGVVLCSNTQLGGFTAMISKMMGPMGGNMTATPTDIKVLIGDDTEGVEAELIARDTELDLAWVKIKEPGDKTFEYLDFSKGEKPEIGSRILMLRRMGKYFARSLVVGDARIGGMTKKPRDLYIPSGALGGGLGLPVYADSGSVVGVLIVQVPDAEDTGGNPLSMMSQATSMQDMMSGLILPAADVAKATKRALETTEDDAEKE
ncbi:MAG: hypothetical protein H6817_04970 [Phycisphaerales bacterium]|nr:hypothetical protein [Phycisphaerales bacterium]